MADDFTAACPGLPGCLSSDGTAEEAADIAKVGKRVWLEAAAALADPVPRERAEEVRFSEPEKDVGTWFLSFRTKNVVSETVCGYN